MKFFVLSLGLAVSFQLSAGVYKCIDASGNKIYRSNPCTENQSKAELNLKTGDSKDLDAIEKQNALTEQEQAAKDAELAEQEQEKLRKQQEFKQNVLDESAKNQFLVKNNPQKFSAFAIPPYEQNNLPPLVKKHENRLVDIERMRRQAAEKTLATGECGRVESVELSQKSTQNALVILVDCSSSKKFYIAEQELPQQ
jgi:hypothetical protein